MTSLKIVPLWGPNAKVAYDNFKIVPPAPPQPFSATIVPVQAISWTPTSALNSYQPQSSTDGSTWINVGPAFTGTAVTSIFVDVPLPYYQVVEGIPSTVESIQNGGFEFVDGSGAPTSWGVVQSQPPTVITTDFHTGAASVRVAVANAANEPNGSEIQQNIVNAGSAPITVGSSYALSFWAKQISSGVSYVQQYKVTWLDGSGNITGNGGFQNFVGGNNTWAQITQSGLTAPANTSSALIQIVGVTGAVSGGLGEVRVDDVSLTTIGFQPVAFLATVMQPGAKIGWPSATGRSYQVKASNDLSAWANVGAAITGDGSRKFYNEAIVQPKKFYRIHETQ